MRFVTPLNNRAANQPKLGFLIFAFFNCKIIMSYIKTALITTGVCAAAVLGYAAYFDYRRRTDASFRKNISTIHVD